MLSAVSRLKPAVNLRFVFEGEEEAGSPHLADYLKKFPEMSASRCLDLSATDPCIKAAHGAGLRRARHR